MSLRHILLGILREPHSGYDIKKTFEHSMSNFWRAELSQIYPLLQKMEKEGLVSNRKGESEIGPTKRIYTRTAKGGRELKSWLKNGPVIGTERFSYLAQVYFLGELKDNAKAIAYLEGLLSHMQEWLESLEQIEREWRLDDSRYPDALPDADFFSQLTLDLGIRKVRTNVEWCEDCLARLHKRHSSS